jgi:hypothetical protein
MGIPLNFFVDSYTPDDEYQHLEKISKTHGSQGFESSFDKLPVRGRVPSGPSYPETVGFCETAIRLARLQVNGQEKVIRLVIKCADFITHASFPSSLHEAGSRDFKFTVVELHLDSQGVGTGVVVNPAKLWFDDRGQLQVLPFDPANVIKLAGVRQVK